MLRDIKQWFALACAVAGLSFLSADAGAAPKKKTPAPSISQFELEPVAEIKPGAELFFRVQGTPNARATVRVSGVGRTLVLQEVDDGVYEGGYTLRGSDKATPASSAVASLRTAGGTARVTMGRLSASPPAPAQPPQAQQPPRPAAPLAISRFQVTPITKIEPGEELRFQLDGTPGGRASFTIENVVANVPMREVSPGHYEGAYTIRRLDKLTGGVPIVATLEANGQAVRTQLNRASVLADTRPPAIRNVHPRDGETVTAGNVSVSGTFDDQGGLGVDPKTVKIVVGGRDVTNASTITPQYFTYRSELNAGTYAADVSARDVAGNQVRQAWTFRVEAAAPPAELPLQITSHSPNAIVPRGALEIRGKTAPGAKVTLNAVGLASVAGMIGISQPLYNGSTTADANGNFAFGFTPAFNAPGLRYELDLKAEDGGRTKETRLVLFGQR